MVSVVPMRQDESSGERTMQIWQMAAVAFVSLAVAVLVVVTRRWHGRWTSDFEASGVQKHHRGAPPRVGLAPLMAGLGLGIYFLANGPETEASGAAYVLSLLLLASLPAVLLGLGDDLTKKVPPRARMLGAAAAAVVAMVLLDVRITRVDIPGVDLLMQWAPVSIAVTILMVCGFTNAMNIVDGLNGLSGGLAVCMLVATGVVARQFGDQLIVDICLALGFSVVGFLLVNFPKGALFLGDGGAYLLGFFLVQIWIMLVGRNPEITPWFIAAVGFHPTMETIFSIYRRRIISTRRSAAMLPDRLHLHSLVYRRRAAFALNGAWAERWVANSAASSVMICFGVVPMVLAVVWPTSAVWNGVVFGLAVTCYHIWFARLVRFKGRPRMKRDLVVDSRDAGEVARAG